MSDYFLVVYNAAVLRCDNFEGNLRYYFKCIAQSAGGCHDLFVKMQNSHNRAIRQIPSAGRIVSAIESRIRQTQVQFPILPIAAEKVTGKKDFGLGIECYETAGRMGIGSFSEMNFAA